MTLDGWKDLVAALDAHGEGLSLPEGVDHPVEVVPVELRHRLWLQACFDALSGLGQEEELTLRDPEEQPDRGVHRRPGKAQGERRVPRPDTGEAAESPDLPPQDEPIFIEMMKKELGLNSLQDKLAERL